MTLSSPSVADTARWVAAMRAVESQRPDAHFHDPFAARLAGELGAEMLHGLKGRWGNTSWPMIARTVLIDDLVRQSVADGIDRVVNLACGFDTRPWRMGLPSELTWVEGDLPSTIEEKRAALSEEPVSCQLRSEPVDLADPVARASFLDGALDGARRALVLTEGLLVYLEPAMVRTLGLELRKRGEVATWAFDLVSPAIRRMMQRSFASKLGESATFRFAPEDGVAFFEALGFRPVDIVSMVKTARALGRLPWRIRLFSYFPEGDPRRPGRRPWSAVVRLVPR